jgi:hypothetical protein
MLNDSVDPSVPGCPCLTDPQILWDYFAFSNAASRIDHASRQPDGERFVRTRRMLIFALLVVILVAVPTVVYLAMNPVDTSLELQVRDAVSRNWIWDATFRLQDRVIRAFYQSDRGTIPFTFTRLKPGEAVLEIEAPQYVPVSIPLRLKRGVNRIEEPIDLVGYEIAGLEKWIIFEKKVGNDIVQQLRPVSVDGPAILNHPCLNLWIGARVSVMVRNGMPVQHATEQLADRGHELFKGRIMWEWDATPETAFRYSSRIPGAEIQANSDPYWVVDYLIIVPDPRKISASEVESIMQEAWKLPLEALPAYLDPFRRAGAFAPYVFTSWNVEGAGS